MYIAILFLPLLGTILGGMFGKHLGPFGSSFLACFFLALTFLYSFFAFHSVLSTGAPVLVYLVKWVVSGSFHITWTLMFDTLTCIMLNVVCFISLLVHVYSTEYMSHDPHLSRFMSYLSFFTFFMLVLVTGDNFLQLFVGWEGVGLCSYLLINFWFTRIQANKAAIKAMILNRIGDVGLALGIFTIFQNFYTINYAIVFALVPQMAFLTVKVFSVEIHLLTLIGILLFVGAMGKSAQLGLHVWLPDAMEGPTPVSALIHAATMVTAGVFLIARCSLIFEYAPDARTIISVLGVGTAFFAATTGLLQNDLKRVIAYSTASQLGYMVFSCGLSNYSCGFFHLSNHAFFKALLFLSAGSVIHAMMDEQDMRKLGGLRRILPFAYAMFVIGSFSLFGLPFLSGFYSKDVILEVAAAKHTTEAAFCFLFGSISAFFTAFYSVRLLYLVFLSEANGYRVVYSNAHETPLRMAVPLIALVFPSVLVGFLSKDMFIGFGTNFWGGTILVRPENQLLVDSEFIPFVVKQTPLLLATSGALLSFFFYRYYSVLLVLLKLSNTGRMLYVFLNRKWFFDRIYTSFVSLPLMSFSYLTTYKKIDKGLIEVTVPKTASYLSNNALLSNRLSPAHLYYSVLLIFLGFLFLVLLNFVSIHQRIFFFQTAFLVLLVLCFIGYTILVTKKSKSA